MTHLPTLAAVAAAPPTAVNGQSSAVSASVAAAARGRMIYPCTSRPRARAVLDTGYIQQLEVKINGVVSPNEIPKGTVIGP